jgi:hypothetical protein
MFRQRHAIHLLVALTPVIVTACGSAQGASQTSSASKTSTTDSPLSAIYGSQDSPSESRRKQLKQEQLVAQCMKDKGWDYTPVDNSVQANATVGDDLADLSPEEYGTKYAYGVTLNYETYELPGLTGGNVAPIDPPVADDPNAEFVAGLDATGQQQYSEDLNGTPVEVPFDETGNYNQPPLDQQGCYGQAAKEVYGDSPFDDPEMGQRLNELLADLQTDPQITGANEQWARCVREADSTFDIGGPDEVFTFLTRVKAELSGQDVVPLDPATGGPQGGNPAVAQGSTRNSDGSGWAFLGQPEPLDARAIEQLRRREFTLYEIDQQCQKKIEMAKIRRRVESQLADRILQEFPQLEQGA